MFCIGKNGCRNGRSRTLDLAFRGQGWNVIEGERRRRSISIHTRSRTAASICCSSYLLGYHKIEKWDRSCESSAWEKDHTRRPKLAWKEERICRWSGVVPIGGRPSDRVRPSPFTPSRPGQHGHTRANSTGDWMDQAGGTLHEATITFQPERPMATNHRGPGLTRSCAVREANRRRYCGDGMTKISSLPSPACLLYRGKCAQMAGKSGQSRPSKCTSPPAARWPPSRIGGQDAPYEKLPFFQSSASSRSSI